MSVLFQYCFCLCFGFQPQGIWAPSFPWCGITPTSCLGEFRFLATGPRGKSPVCCLEMSKQITIMVTSDYVLFLHLFIHEDLNNSLVEMEGGGRQGKIS